MATNKKSAKKPVKAAKKSAVKKMTSTKIAKSSKKKVLKKDLPPKAKKLIDEMKTDEPSDMEGFECGDHKEEMI